MRTFTPSASDAYTYGLAACLLGRGRTCQPELSKVRSLDNAAEPPYLPGETSWGVAGSQAARQSAALASIGGANVPDRIHRPHRHRCSRPRGCQAVLRRAHADPGASGLVRDE